MVAHMSTTRLAPASGYSCPESVFIGKTFPCMDRSVYGILDGYKTLSIVEKPSLIVLWDMNRVNNPAVPALSFVPLDREPPNGCCPGIAPVH
jgi:hypothetical protein